MVVCAKVLQTALLLVTLVTVARPISTAGMEEGDSRSSSSSSSSSSSRSASRGSRTSSSGSEAGNRNASVAARRQLLASISGGGKVDKLADFYARLKQADVKYCSDRTRLLPACKVRLV